MSKKEFYYVRVSTKEQNLDRQLDYLKEHAITIDERDIFCDKQSGKNFDRPEYQTLKKILRSGDTLYVKSIDRFGRNYNQIVAEWKELTSRGIDIVVLDMPLLDTRKDKDVLGTLITDLVFQRLSYVADTELENIRTRQAEGIKSALDRGVAFGRPRKEITISSSDFEDLYSQWKCKIITTKHFRESLNLKHSSFYRQIADHETKIIKGNN